MIAGLFPVRCSTVRNSTATSIEAESSGISDLKAFVVELRQDFDAILPCSQRQTEGRVNKLKLIK